MGFFGRRKEGGRKHGEVTDPKAQIQTAIRYSEGIGVRRNPTKAQKLLAMSQADGIPDLTQATGFLDSAPENGAVTFAANRWYRLAAERGSTEAQFDLGFNFERGIGGEADMKEAVRWYTRAANGGSGKAMFRLGCIFASVEGATDYDAAYEWLEKAVADGNSRAGYVLYVLYSEGIGLDEPNTFLAEKYLRGAAEEGDVSSMYMLAHLLLYGGEHTDRDTLEAWRMMESAALAGSPPAVCSLGVMYCYGIGGRNPDREIAFDLLSSVSDMSPIAANALGLMHLYAMTDDCVPLEARGLFERAAGVGIGAAMNNLAVLSAVTGAPDDELRKEFGQAAEAGSERAKANLDALSAGRPLACELSCGSMEIALTMDKEHISRILQKVE